MKASLTRTPNAWQTRVRVLWAGWRPWFRSNWWFWYRDHQLIVVGVGPVSVFVDLVPGGDA